MQQSFENMPKEELLEFAEANKIAVDKRMSAANMAAAIREALAEQPVREPDAEPTAPTTPKIKAVKSDRMSPEGLQAIATGWAQVLCKYELQRVVMFAYGDTLSIKIETRHGVTPIDVHVDDWSPSGVEAALAEAEKQLVPGEHAPEPDKSWLQEVPNSDPVQYTQECKDRLISYAVSNKIEISTAWKADRILAEILRAKSEG